MEGNRPALRTTVIDDFDTPHVLADVVSARTTDAEHGRTESRHAWVSHDLDWMHGPTT